MSSPRSARSLRTLLRLLRAEGVTEFTGDGLTIRLGSQPSAPQPARKTPPADEGMTYGQRLTHKLLDGHGDDA